jgi:Fe-S-cluster containining protein
MPPLFPILDAALADSGARSGDWLACKPGCHQCCVGVFTISQRDAQSLREGLAQAEIATADRIRGRVAASIARLTQGFPGDLVSGLLFTEPHHEEAFEEFANDEPCPVLDPEHGTCDLYAARPILCRTFGPPMRTEENNLATCELCYIHASTDEIAACELDPAFPAIEEQSNAAYDAATGRHGQTLIAYALRGSLTLQR